MQEWENIVEAYREYLRGNKEKGEYHLGGRKLAIYTDRITYSDEEVYLDVASDFISVIHPRILRKFEELCPEEMQKIEKPRVYFGINENGSIYAKYSSWKWDSPYYYIRDIDKIRELLFELFTILPEFKEKIDKLYQEYHEELKKIPVPPTPEPTPEEEKEEKEGKREWSTIWDNVWYPIINDRQLRAVLRKITKI